MHREIVSCSHDLANRKPVGGVELLTLPQICIRTNGASTREDSVHVRHGAREPGFRLDQGVQDALPVTEA
jgi:hypothetical protein